MAFELEKIKKVTEMLPYINKKQKNTIFNDEGYMNIPNIEIIKLDGCESVK